MPRMNLLRSLEHQKKTQQKTLNQTVHLPETKEKTSRTISLKAGIPLQKQQRGRKSKPENAALNELKNKRISSLAAHLTLAGKNPALARKYLDAAISSSKQIKAIRAQNRFAKTSANQKNLGSASKSSGIFVPRDANKERRDRWEVQAELLATRRMLIEAVHKKRSKHEINELHALVKELEEERKIAK